MIFDSSFAISGNIVQMVAYALHTVRVTAKTLGDFNHDFRVFFCSGCQVGQTAARFERNAGICPVFGFWDGDAGIFCSDGTGFVTQEPVIYFTVQGHRFVPIQTSVCGWFVVRHLPFGYVV